MKYTLEGFSQEAALSMRATITENGTAKTIKLDLIDLTIIRWIIDFYPNMKKTIIEGAEYVWLDYSTFIEDMPLLGLSKQSLYKRCAKMVQLGVLKHATVRNGGTFSYYGLGPEYSRLVSNPRKAAQSPTQDAWAATSDTNTTRFTEPQPLLAEPEPKPQPKKPRKSKSFDDIIDAYTSDPTTKKLLGQWLQNRKAKRAAMTDGAIQGNLDKLDKCAQESRMNVNDYLSEVICRGWGSFFAIENYKRTGYQQQKPQQQHQPSWETTPEERRQQEEEDEYFLKHCVF